MSVDFAGDFNDSALTPAAEGIAAPREIESYGQHCGFADSLTPHIGAAPWMAPPTANFRGPFHDRLPQYGLCRTAIRPFSDRDWTYLAFFSGPHRQPLSENIQSRARLARVPYGGCRATWIDEIRPCWNTGLSFEKVRKPSSRGSAPCRSRRRRRKGGRVVPPAGSPR